MFEPRSNGVTCFPCHWPPDPIVSCSRLMSWVSQPMEPPQRMWGRRLSHGCAAADHGVGVAGPMASPQPTPGRRKPTPMAKPTCTARAHLLVLRSQLGPRLRTRARFGGWRPGRRAAMLSGGAQKRPAPPGGEPPAAKVGGAPRGGGRLHDRWGQSLPQTTTADGRPTTVFCPVSHPNGADRNQPMATATEGGGGERRRRRRRRRSRRRQRPR